MDHLIKPIIEFIDKLNIKITKTQFAKHNTWINKL